MDQEHLGDGVPGAHEVPPDQASADFAIVEANFTAPSWNVISEWTACPPPPAAHADTAL